MEVEPDQGPNYEPQNPDEEGDLADIPDEVYEEWIEATKRLREAGNRVTHEWDKSFRKAHGEEDWYNDVPF